MAQVGNLDLERKMVKTDRVGCVMRPVAIGIAAASTLGLGLLGFSGCSSKPAGSTAAPKAEPPAKVAVSKLPTEADLVVVTLKPEAETRLGIATAQVVRKSTPRSMTIGGDIMVPPGRASIYQAPQTGRLVLPEGGSAPEPGMTVEKGKTIFNLLPILSADRAVLNPIERVNFGTAKATAEGQKKTAQSRFDNAKTVLERTEQLTRNRDVPASTLVDARNAYDQAKATLDAANDTWSIFSKATGDGDNEADAGKLAPLAIKSPAAGVLIQLMVQPGQQVTAGSFCSRSPRSTRSTSRFPSSSARSGRSPPTDPPPWEAWPTLRARRRSRPSRSGRARRPTL